MKKFNEIEIKAGYLLVVKTGDEIHNMTVIPDSDDELACSTFDKHWWPLGRFNSNGKFLNSQVIAVYGRVHPRYLMANSTVDRELLWERKEPTKMTVAEICEALGYEVEIIK